LSPYLPKWAIDPASWNATCFWRGESWRLVASSWWAANHYCIQAWMNAGRRKTSRYCTNGVVTTNGFYCHGIGPILAINSGVDSFHLSTSLPPG